MEVSEKNYIDFPGISTATGVANITTANIVSRIDITDPGSWLCVNSNSYY